MHILDRGTLKLNNTGGRTKLEWHYSKAMFIFHFLTLEFHAGCIMVTYFTASPPRMSHFHSPPVGTPPLLGVT
jgi:hypothetical protein